MVEKPIHEEFEHIVDEKYQLENLINMDDLRKILDDFHKIAPFPVAVLNLKGEVLLESHWEPICTQFHRVNPKTASICTESDTHFNAELGKGDERQILYRCGNGLYDAASPILIEGQHLGNFFIGQFLLEPPDEGFFRKQAQRYGFEEEGYLEALSRVPIISESDLKTRLDYLCGFAEFLGNIGLKEFQRDRVEKALQESEERYRTLMDNLPVAVYRNTPGPEGQFLMANPAFCNMFGFKNEEEVKKVAPASLYQHPEERKQYSDNLIEKGVFKNDERALQKRDGTPVYTSITSRVVYRKNGEISHFDSIMLDITEQKLAEEALRESEQKYRSLFEESRDAIVFTTQQGNFIDANPAALELFGYTKEEMLKLNFQKLYVDPNEGYNFQKEMKEKGSVQDFETKLRGKGDVEMDCIFDVVCRRGDNESILGYQGIIRDISEAKRTQERLKTSQQRLSQIINFLPDATFVIDNEGKVIAWNQAIENMTSVKAKEILGKGDYEYAIPFYGERRPTLIDLASKWNKEIEEKYQYVKKEGESLVSETYDTLTKPGGFLQNKACLLYDSAGEVMGAIESIRDITDRKVAEDALRES